MPTIKRALISVSDKAGIVEFAQALDGLGVEILATGGTARLLADNRMRVTEVSAYTGYPEIMDGRLKTLHPQIHGGLLGRRAIDTAVMAEHGIQPIDLLVVNLYPFERTVADPDCDFGTAVENIDIGGPAMLRAAAKNHAAVTVVVDAADYQRILAEMREHHGAVSDATRLDLATRAFEYTACYDSAIANWLGSITNTGERAFFPRTLSLQFIKTQEMRYGENPHQRAAFYRERDAHEACVASARQLQGRALSYNNVADTDAALECVKSFTEPACVIVKHANPCGVAIGSDLLSAYERAFQTDPMSAFGGIIAFNRRLDRRTAEAVVTRQFVEVIIAPAVDDDALLALATKQNVRVLSCGPWDSSIPSGLDFKGVTGGLLVQDRDAGRIDESTHSVLLEAKRHARSSPGEGERGKAYIKVVTRRAPTAQESQDLLFAWKIVKFVKSNAIVYCKDGQTRGIGAGQMSRVYAAKIAGLKAAEEGLDVKGSVMASDAFFPFRDSIDAAAEAGVAAVIEPGGSVRDEEVIAAADEHGMAMVFTAMRHFRH